MRTPRTTADSPRRLASTADPTVESQRRTLERYERQVRLLEGVVSTTPDFVYLFDREGRFQYANRRLLEVWGMQLSEVIGKTCRELGYEQWHHEMHMCEIAQVIATKQPIKGEVPFEAPRTRTFGIYEYIFTPVLDATGEVELIAGTTRDVTERKRTEQALLASEERSRASEVRASTIALNVQDYLVILECVRDAAGTIVDWRYVDINDATMRLLARSRSEVIGRTVRELLPSRQHVTHERMNRVLATGQTENYETAFAGRAMITRLFRIDERTVGSSAIDITARKRVEDELNRSEARYRALVEVGEHHVWVAGADGRSEGAAQWFEEFTGLPRSSSDDRDSWFAAVHPEDQARLAAERSAAAQSTRLFETHFRLLHVSKTYRDIELRAVPILDSSGARTEWVGTLADVTEQWRAEVARRESEHRLRLATSAAELGVFDWDFATAAAHWQNERMFRIFGLDPHSDLTTGSDVYADAIVQEDRTMVIGALAQAQRSDDPVRLRFRIHRYGDGELRWLELLGRYELSTSGLPRRFIGVVRDITEKRRAEQAIEESESFYRQMLESIPGMVFTARPDGSVDFQSQQWADYTGVPMREHLGDGWNDLLHPDDRARALASWRAAVAGTTTYELEYRVLRRDGEYEWFRVIGQPLRDGAGKVARWLGVAMNVEKLKRAEESLIYAKAQLEEVDRRKNDFIAVLSHELRNPLAPIRNSLYVLHHAPPGGDQALRSQEVIHRQVNHLSRLVDDLLDLTRVSRNKVVLQREPLELNDLVRRATEDQRSLFDTNGVGLHLQLVEETIVVNGDEARLVQVVSNLLQNAAKFTPRGGATTVSVGLATIANRAVIRVRDTGVGMSAETTARLFQPFMQADATLERSQGGLGLGLALVKGLVTLHDGEVNVRSAGLGQGSEFEVLLPVSSEQLVGISARVPQARRSGCRVLIIEDNVDAAASMQDLLELEHHEVAVAHNGIDGIAVARNFAPALVFCDLGLPGMDGFEVARAFRSDPELRDVYLVALSGYALPEDIRRTIEAGFERHVAKPPSIEQLLDAIGAAERTNQAREHVA